MSKLYCRIIIALLSLSFVSNAGPNLPVPRFVTIKFDEVNARTGPENDCPIGWVFTKKGEPVEVIAQYGQWRKIRDIDNDGGWVHSSVISGNRSVIINSNLNINLMDNPDVGSQVIAVLAPKIRCKLLKCHPDWCRINCQSYKGWVPLKSLWGVYPEEFAIKS